MRPTVSRRVVLKWIAGLVAVVAAWGPRPLLAGAPDGDVDGDGLRVQLPERQHAWDESLATDESGNHVPPRFHRLLFFDVASQPDSTSARLLESRLRTLESRYPWGPSGLLFLAAWGPGYWERWLRTAPPIEYPKPLTTFEIPVLDDYDIVADVGAYAARVEALGVDALHVPETIHDGLSVALLALEHTERISVTTGVVVAFARSPMLLLGGAARFRKKSGQPFEYPVQPAGTDVRCRFGMLLGHGRFGLVTFKGLCGCCPESIPARSVGDNR